MDKEQSTSYEDSPWTTIRKAERRVLVRDGTIRAAIERGELVAYRRKGGKGAIVNIHDVDDWVRNTWPQVKGEFA